MAYTPEQQSQQLRNATGDCTDMCGGTGGQLRNTGIVRMQVMVNDYCPFFNVQEQLDDFVFNSMTFGALSEQIQAKVRSYGAGMDGVTMPEKYLLRSNLIFARAKSDDPLPKVVGAKHRLVADVYDSGTSKSKRGHAYIPHYAWEHTGSLFDNDVIDPDAYEKPSPGATPPKLAQVNVPKWTYKTVNVPVPKVEKSVAATATPQQPNVLFPEVATTGAKSDTRGVHWSVEKRRSVYQCADFFLLVHRTASESTIQNKVRPLRGEYGFLDANLGNPNVPNSGTASGHDGTVINNGMVELNDAGGINEESRDLLDLNNQVYLIIEIGKGHYDHNYFLILAEKSNPVLIHASQQPIAVRDGDGVKVVIPSTTTSRRLSVYSGASSASLLKEEKLGLTVRNLFGRLVIVFSGYEDNPWIIERKDFDSTSGELKDEFVPMVVPNAPLVLHGGNIRCAFNWGYVKYEPEVNVILPQTVQIEGRGVQRDSVSLYLQMVDKDDRVANVMNDTSYYHDGGVFEEVIGGKSKVAYAAVVQPNSYRECGKGSVYDANDLYIFPDQGSATPTGHLSSASVYIAGGLRDLAGSAGYASEFNVGFRLRSGHYTFAADDETEEGDPVRFFNVISPAITGYSLYVSPGGNRFPLMNLDVSGHVMSFTESWTAQDYMRIEHSGTIKFLINEGMEPVARDSVNLRPKRMPNRADRLLDLAKGSFYIRIKAWYQDSGVFPNQRPDDQATVFTGICHAGKITYSNNNRVLECHVSDLTKVLQDQTFLNGPFFDSVRDYNAVNEILMMAGFKERGDVAPSQMVAQGARRGDRFLLTYKDVRPGRKTSSVECIGFALPGSYNRLTQPMFRPKDTDRYMDWIVQMAERAGKCVYFDRYGTFHYEDRIDALIATGMLTDADAAGMAKEHFFASPLMTGCENAGQVAFNSYTWQYLAGDVYNQIIVASASPEGALLVAGDKNYEMIYNPGTPGFLGYPKQLVQMNGVFGSEAAVRSIVDRYTAFYKPPIQCSFETYGRSWLKALDIITFTGLDPASSSGRAQPLRITSISTEIDPQRNVWWSKFDCEWIFGGDGVNWNS